MTTSGNQLSAAAADSLDSRDEAIEAIAEELVSGSDESVMESVADSDELLPKFDALLFEAVNSGDDAEKLAAIDGIREIMVQAVTPIAAEIFEQQRADAIEAAGYDD